MINNFLIILSVATLTSCNLQECSIHKFGSSDHKICMERFVHLKRQFNQDDDACRAQAEDACPYPEEMVFYKDRDMSEKFVSQDFGPFIACVSYKRNNCMNDQMHWKNIHNSAEGKYNEN